MVALLRDLGFTVPLFTAVIKWLGRLPTWQGLRLLAQSAGAATVAVAALDSTGFSKVQPSAHYTRRIDGTTPAITVKWSALINTRTRRVLASFARVKPAHDVRDVDRVLNRCQTPIRKLVADKGYDSERVHESCHDRGMTSIIPSRRGVRRGFYRRKMKPYNKPPHLPPS